MKAIVVDSVSKSILKTLLYFDIFNYPLKSLEVYHFLQSNHVTPELIQEKLQSLSNQGLAFQFDRFYSLQNNTDLVERRLKGNDEAKKYLDLASRQARLIQRFPFVKSVMASGSLSKGYMDDSCDLDFFIITQARRLWIARTLLVLYKRIFLGNSHKFFCVNYFVDECNLEIEEKNIYTATELATLIPLSGNAYYEKLLKANGWMFNYLPNTKINKPSSEKSEIFRLKVLMEFILNIFFPSFVNSLLMRKTLDRWKKLYRDKYSPEDFKVAFKTKTDVSKNHPNYYQKKVIDVYQSKVAQFTTENNLSWKA